MPKPLNCLSYAIFLGAFTGTHSIAMADTVTGTPGVAGTAGGGAGGDGGDASASSGSNTTGEASAIGGNGGAGGAGTNASGSQPASGGGTGGNGGKGGYANAYAVTNASDGPGVAIADAIGGIGGVGGVGGQPGGSSGTPGLNGGALAQASTTAVGSASATATANATGAYALANAFASSDSGNVYATANVVSDDLTFLNDAANGSTSGAMFLAQNLTARFNPQGGGGHAINSFDGNRTGMSLLNLSLNTIGASGTSHLASQGNGGVSAFDLSADCPIVANATATGGNGFGQDSNYGFWGGTGLAEAFLTSTGSTAATSSVSLTAHAIGGAGAAASSQGGSGGWGGYANGEYSASSQLGDVTVHVTFAPGSGGAGYGVGNAGGSAGQADIEPINANSGSGAVDLSTSLHAGNGGDGYDGASAADGGDARLFNVGHAFTSGRLTVSQSAVAGNGGSVHSNGAAATAGNGGTANSYLDPDTVITQPAATFSASAIGGNGGDVDGSALSAFGPGHAGSAAIHVDLQATGTITGNALSVGGNSGSDHGTRMLPGGTATASVNVSSSSANAADAAVATSRAYGGIGMGSPDSTQGANSGFASAASAATQNAAASAAAYAYGGASTLGRGGDGNAFASATGNAALTASAVAVGGAGTGIAPYFLTGGGSASATASISFASGSVSADATAGSSSADFYGGGAMAQIFAGNLEIVQIAGPSFSQGRRAVLTYNNGSFTALANNNADLGVYGTGSVTTTSLLGVGTLSVNNNATLRLARGMTNNDVFELTFSASGKLDLTDNVLTLRDGSESSTLTRLRSQLAAGQLFSTAADASHTLGYGANDTSIIIKLAYLGDLNLDGKVDIADLGTLAAHWQQSGYWTDGDLDYTGKIDIADLGSLAANWQAGVISPSAVSFTQALASVGLDSPVPEPSALLSSALLALLRRRRRTWC